MLTYAVVRMNRPELDADDGTSRLVGLRHGFKSQRFAAWSQVLSLLAALLAQKYKY
jgi:hypothetical protein